MRLWLPVCLMMTASMTAHGIHLLLYCTSRDNNSLPIASSSPTLGRHHQQPSCNHRATIVPPSCSSIREKRETKLYDDARQLVVCLVHRADVVYHRQRHDRAHVLLSHLAALTPLSFVTLLAYKSWQFIRQVLDQSWLHASSTCLPITYSIQAALTVERFVHFGAFFQADSRQNTTDEIDTTTTTTTTIKEKRKIS